MPPEAAEDVATTALPVATEDLDVQVDNATTPQEDAPATLSVQLPPTEERVV